eukprot:3661334-Amphidinium_carterae.2
MPIIVVAMRSDPAYKTMQVGQDVMGQCLVCECNSRISFTRTWAHKASGGAVELYGVVCYGT